MKRGRGSVKNAHEGKPLLRPTAASSETSAVAETDIRGSQTSAVAEIHSGGWSDDSSSDDGDREGKMKEASWESFLEASWESSQGEDPSRWIKGNTPPVKRPITYFDFPGPTTDPGILAYRRCIAECEAAKRRYAAGDTSMGTGLGELTHTLSSSSTAPNGISGEPVIE